MTDPLNSPEIISIASGKGGTGKTLLLVSLAYALQQAGNSVLLVDFDLATEGLSHFVLGSDGISRLQTFREENTVSGYFKNFQTDEPAPEISARTVNRGQDQEIIYEAIISGRGLYGDLNSENIAEDTSASQHEDRIRAAVRALFDQLRSLNRDKEDTLPYDYVLVDTRGGFGLLTTYVCALSDSYILVTEPTTASLYQNRKLHDRILGYADRENLRPYVRGAIVNKAVRDIEPKLSEDEEQMVFDADEIERRFRGDLAQSLGIDIDNTYGIPSDLAAVETYAFQRIPFSHARGSLFALTTMDAFSGLMEMVTVEWPVERLETWNQMVRDTHSATLEAFQAGARDLAQSVDQRAKTEIARIKKESAEHANKMRSRSVLVACAGVICGVGVAAVLLYFGLIPAGITQSISGWIGGGAIYAN